eukprot:gene8282-8469_t
MTCSNWHPHHVPSLPNCSSDGLQANNLKLVRALLDTFFAEANRINAGQQLGNQSMCTALFLAGQLVSRLSSAFKGQSLVDGVLEALRYTYLVYNGSVHYWHAARPLQQDKLYHYLLPTVEQLCQVVGLVVGYILQHEAPFGWGSSDTTVLEKVEGQQAWRLQYLMLLALCQADAGRLEEALKSLSKGSDLAASAGLQHLKVDPHPEGLGQHALLHVVARIGWAAALVGHSQLAEQCAQRGYASQAAPPATLVAAGNSYGLGCAVTPEAVKARLQVLQELDEVVAAFAKLRDTDGVHYSAKLAWNAGLPLLQPCHRTLLKPCFAAVSKALETVCSPFGKLQAALNLEVAKAEADSDSFIKAFKEVARALSFNYPSDAAAATTCGYERELDRFLQPLARSARLRGGMVAELAPAPASADSCSLPPGLEDDVVLFLERARDSKSAALRAEYLCKTELWGDVVQLAWVPHELEAIVRSAAPYMLAADWKANGDKEMLFLQARTAYIEADACKAALQKLDVQVKPPAGYSAALHNPPQLGAATRAFMGLAATGGGNTDQAGPYAAEFGEDGVRLPATEAQQLQRLYVEDILLGMRLAAAAGHQWVVDNGIAAAWNTFLPVLHKHRHAELAGLSLPLLQQFLKKPGPGQDIRAAMALLSAMPTVNLELWAQLARAAGKQHHWQLAVQCAAAAMGALPADKRDLAAVAAPADVPNVTAQGWYWLSVAELQRGQAVMSLMNSEGLCGVASLLVLCHKAVCHFAQAAKLAGFIHKADLAEAAARHAWNSCQGLLATGLTQASIIPQLRMMAAALNATRPADCSFQVSLNVLLLRCLAAAGQWTAARQHAETLQRCLPLKTSGPFAAAAATVAAWRAVCLAHAPTGRAAEDMNRLVAELATPTAKASVWLAFAQACSNYQDQLAGRKAALASLEGHSLEQVEYHIEAAEWLAESGCDADGLPSPETLLLTAAAAILRTAVDAAALMEETGQELQHNLLRSRDKGAGPLAEQQGRRVAVINRTALGKASESSSLINWSGFMCC